MPSGPSLAALSLYFLRLGALGFGGPVALAGAMHRDLVEQRKWLSGADYELALTVAQVMPGPLAAQLAMAIGYLKAGLVGATVVALAFILPSFAIVVALAAVYAANAGLWWVQALFYTVGASVIAIIALAAYRLARSTNATDPLRWAIFVTLLVATVWSQAELAELFIFAGLVAMFLRAPPNLRRLFRSGAAGVVPLALVFSTGVATPSVLLELLLFFAKAGAFVFGSGLAIVPFLHQGVVLQNGWLDEHQFLDAVAVAIITPGPVVITVAFIGFLVAGFAGASAAALGMFLPVYLFTVVPLPHFKRHRDNPQLGAFVSGATAAATGAIAGAVVVLGQRAITDVPTAAVAVASLAALGRLRTREPLVIAVSGVAGLVLSSVVPR